MRILLTGGTGYIGSNSAVELVQNGHKVVLLDNLSNSRRGVVDTLERITKVNLRFIEGDIRDTTAIQRILEENQIEAVIHFAGIKAVAESVEYPIEYFDQNVAGTISLLKAMSNTGTRKLVFSSSATVYGNPEYLPIDEMHPRRATNPYGRCKLHIEEMLADVTQSSKDWAVACLRYFNPVGAHQSGLIGEDPQGTPNNLVPYIANVAAGQSPELYIFGGDYPTTDGTGVRDYIHVSDLAEGHCAALGYIEYNSGWHAFNLGTGRGYSVLEMVYAFERASGKQIPYCLKPRRKGDVAVSYANVDKAQKLLHWTARRSKVDMCASAWQFKKISIEQRIQGQFRRQHTEA